MQTPMEPTFYACSMLQVMDSSDRGPRSVHSSVLLLASITPGQTRLINDVIVLASLSSLLSITITLLSPLAMNQN